MMSSEIVSLENHFMLMNQLAQWRELASMELPNPLIHINSDLCWCDPIIEVDENDRDVVIHKEVTWN
jgi:hypothetical protein